MRVGGKNIKRLIVGISGATGAIYGIRLMEVLKEIEIQTHLILTEAAKKTILLETEFRIDYVESLADYVYDVENIGGGVASGSFVTEGMIVIPCSMKSLSAIANSFNDNLLIRAADVTLKEGRRLVLVVRETPLHKGHLQLMMRAAENGAVIFPPVPAFYYVPKTIEGIVNHTIGKILDLFKIEHHLCKRWNMEDGNKAMDLLAMERVKKETGARGKD
jgi:4-hydroxy-3-polyprenylbenzoate decarboxylase